MLPFLALVPPPAVTLNLPADPRPKEPVRLVIDTDQRTLSVYSDLNLYRTFPVAVGKPSTPTPLGSWQIAQKAVWGGAFGTRWMRLSIPYGIYGVHGTNNPGSVGHFASHGCVRMLNRDVEQVYAWVEEGTPVDVVGTPPRRAVAEGSRGSEVSDIQRALLATGDYQGPVSGVFTPELTTAVEKFQLSHGMRVTGVVHRSTYEALGLYPPKRVDPPWLEKASRPPAKDQEQPASQRHKPVLLAAYGLARRLSGAPRRLMPMGRDASWTRD